MQYCSFTSIATCNIFNKSSLQLQYGTNLSGMDLPSVILRAKASDSAQDQSWSWLDNFVSSSLFSFFFVLSSVLVLS